MPAAAGVLCCQPDSSSCSAKSGSHPRVLTGLSTVLRCNAEPELSGRLVTAQAVVLLFYNQNFTVSGKDLGQSHYLGLINQSWGSDRLVARGWLGPPSAWHPPTPSDFEQHNQSPPLLSHVPLIPVDRLLAARHFIFFCSSGTSDPKCFSQAANSDGKLQTLH